MKSRGVIFLEGCLYVIIAAGSPFAEFLTSDRPATQRALTACGVIALVGAANALKAYLSQSMSNREPIKTEVTNTAENPVKTEET